MRTGFVLLEGSSAEQHLLDGYLMWLEFSGAGESAGIPVGQGSVRITHLTEYAVNDGTCESYHAAAQRLIAKEAGPFAVILFFPCCVWRHDRAAVGCSLDCLIAARSLYRLQSLHLASVLSPLADLLCHCSVPYVHGQLVSHVP